MWSGRALCWIQACPSSTKTRYSFSLGLPLEYRKNKSLVGILGSPNGNVTDDWMMRNGALIKIPASTNDRLYQPAYENCSEQIVAATA